MIIYAINFVYYMVSLVPKKGILTFTPIWQLRWRWHITDVIIPSIQFLQVITFINSWWAETSSFKSECSNHRITIL